MRRFSLLFFTILTTVLMFTGGCIREPLDTAPDTLLSWTKWVGIEDIGTYKESLTKTPDDGFLVAGYITHDDNPVTHGMLMRFSSEGDRIWWKKYDIEGYTKVYADYALQRNDGSILLTGSCWEEGLPTSTFLAFLDNEGDLTSRVLYEVAANLTVTDRKIFLNTDGTILLACKTVDDDAVILTEKSSLVINLLDSDGGVIEAREYANVSAILDQTFQTENGEIFLTGATRPDKLPESPDDLEILFLLIDNAGNESYRVTGGTNSWDAGLSVTPAWGGGFNIAGKLTYDNQPVLIPVSPGGIAGDQIPVADTIHTYGLVIKQICNDEYLLLNQSRTRVYFSKLRSDLSIVWTTWLDNPFPSDFGPPYITDLVRLNDGSFAFLYMDVNVGTTLNKTVPFN